MRERGNLIAARPLSLMSHLPYTQRTPVDFVISLGCSSFIRNSWVIMQTSFQQQDVLAIRVAHMQGRHIIAVSIFQRTMLWLSPFKCMFLIFIPFFLPLCFTGRQKDKTGIFSYRF